MPKLRFHLLGAAHLETTRLNSACPFTQKIVRLADMLKRAIADDQGKAQQRQQSDRQGDFQGNAEAARRL